MADITRSGRNPRIIKSLSREILIPDPLLSVSVSQSIGITFSGSLEMIKSSHSPDELLIEFNNPENAGSSDSVNIVNDDHDTNYIVNDDNNDDHDHDDDIPS